MRKRERAKVYRSRMVAKIKRGLKRLRHRKGHGVHSPYIYNIVRDVFMVKSYPSKINTPLLNTLKTLISKDKVCHQINSLASYCGYRKFSVDVVGDGCQLVICTQSIGVELIEEIIHHASRSGITVVILSPYSSHEREVLIGKIVDTHLSTTVDKREYFIVFNNHLPKQHFEL